MRKNLLYIPFLLLLVFSLTGCGEKKLESISLDVDKSIPINETKEVNVYFEPDEVKEEITWSSSNEDIASVSNGIITTKGIGNATITATTTSGIKDQVNIEVYQKVESLTFDNQNVGMYVGDTSQINATITPDEATYKNITWTSSSNSVATVENGLITAKGAGKATITATTKDGVSQKCNVLVKEKPIEFSGSGDKIISNIKIPSGIYKATLSNSGAHNFIVELYENSNDSYGDLLANEIGAYNGSVIIKNGETKAITDGMLEIKSSGKWNIKFEPVNGTILGKSVSGSGNVVTGWFKGDGRRQVATFTNKGLHNFIVEVYDEYGNSDLLVNEIGAYNGQATFVTKSSRKYYYSIISSGDWSISWE